jgi:hypothetical protein
VAKTRTFAQKFCKPKSPVKRDLVSTVQKLGLEEIGLKAMPALIAALKDDNV